MRRISYKKRRISYFVPPLLPSARQSQTLYILFGCHLHFALKRFAECLYVVETTLIGYIFYVGGSALEHLYGLVNLVFVDKFDERHARYGLYLFI